MDYEVEIRHHAFLQALKRNITPDQIDDCINNGGRTHHGKHYVKYKTKSLVCVGERIGNKIKIITITRP